MSNTNTQSANFNAIASKIDELAIKLAKTNDTLIWAALTPAAIAFVGFIILHLVPWPAAPIGAYKYQIELIIYIMHYLILLVATISLYRRAVFIQSVAMDYRYKQLTCELLASAIKIEADHNNGTLSEITMQITHTALKIIAENPTRLLGSWERPHSESATAEPLGDVRIAGAKS